MIGFEPDEIQMDIEKWRSFIFEEDKPNIDKSLIAHLKQEEELFEEDFRVKCKDGSLKWIKAKAKAIFDENGRAFNVVDLKKAA